MKRTGEVTQRHGNTGKNTGRDKHRGGTETQEETHEGIISYNIITKIIKVDEVRPFNIVYCFQLTKYQKKMQTFSIFWVYTVSQLFWNQVCKSYFCPMIDSMMYWPLPWPMHPARFTQIRLAVFV